MPRVVHFEIHSEDPERAMRFYSSLFGWTFTKWDGPQDYWEIRTGPAGVPGIDGGLVRRRETVDGQAVIAFVCTVDVAVIGDTIQSIAACGGSIVVDKMPVPGVGWLAYGKDTEGNIFGVMQADAGAR